MIFRVVSRAPKPNVRKEVTIEANNGKPEYIMETEGALDELVSNKDYNAGHKQKMAAVV